MRIKRVLSWLIPIVLLSLLTYIFGYSNLLQVKKIEITGVENQSWLTKVVSEPKLHFQVGSQLARVNVRGAQKELSNLGWIEKVKVSRDWLKGVVKVEVLARAPVAQVISKDLNTDSYIDGTGTIFTPPIQSSGLPLMTIAGESQAPLAAAFITQFPKDLLGKMQTLLINQNGDAIMTLARGSKSLLINWGSSQDLNEKIKVYQALSALPENKVMQSLDVSNPANPLVKS